MDLKAVGQRIKAAREAKNLTQEELAALVNLSTTHVSVIERGLKVTKLDTLSDMTLVIEPTKTSAGTRKLPVTEDVAKCFQAIIEDREKPKVEKVVDGYTGFLFLDDKGLPLVAMHWEHRFNHMVKRYNDIYRVQMPNITPHGRVIIRTS